MAALDPFNTSLFPDLWQGFGLMYIYLVLYLYKYIYIYISTAQYFYVANKSLLNE